jgi:hypothetical protein
MDQIANDLCVGAANLAVEIFGTEKEKRQIYNPKIQREFGLFHVAGKLAGLRSEMRRKLAAKTQAT